MICISKRSKPFVSAVLSASLICLLLGCETSEGDLIPLDQAARTDSIVNGEPTYYMNWKGVVGVIYSDGDTAALCTGTLITRDIVISAGHCVFDPYNEIDGLANPENIWITGGSDLFLAPIHYSKAAKVVIHPQWKGDITDSHHVDLSLIKLETPIDTVRSFRIRKGPALEINETGKIVGYGLSSAFWVTSGGVHRVGTASVLDFDDRGFMELGTPSGTCSGDSGGPFFTRQDDRWVLTGITSFREGFVCKASGEGWSVNAMTYREWIGDTVERLTGEDMDAQDLQAFPPIDVTEIGPQHSDATITTDKEPMAPLQPSNAGDFESEPPDVDEDPTQPLYSSPGGVGCTAAVPRARTHLAAVLLQLFT